MCCSNSLGFTKIATAYSKGDHKMDDSTAERQPLSSLLFIDCLLKTALDKDGGTPLPKDTSRQLLQQVLLEVKSLIQNIRPDASLITEEQIVGWYITVASEARARGEDTINKLLCSKTTPNLSTTNQSSQRPTHQASESNMVQPEETIPATATEAEEATPPSFLYHLHQQMEERKMAALDTNTTLSRSVYVYGQINIFQVAVKKITEALSSAHSLIKLERAITEFFRILNDSMEVRRIGKRRAAEKVERLYPSIDFKNSLAEALHIFVEKENASAQNQLEDIIKDAIGNWEAYSGVKDKRSWEKKVKIQEQEKSFIALCAFLVFIVRMCHQITLETFIERISSDHLRKQTDQFRTDLVSLGVTDQEHSITITDLYDTVILPNFKGGSPNKAAAFRVSTFIMEKMANKQFVEYAAVAELAPADTPLLDIMGTDQLSELKFSNAEPSFMSGSSDTHQRRRKTAATILGTFAVGPVFTDCLDTHSVGNCLLWKSMGENSFTNLLCFLPQSSFRQKKFFKTLLKNGDQIIKGIITESLKQEIEADIVGCELEKKFGSGYEAFARSHIFVDISGDLANRTSVKYDALESYMS